MVTTLKIVTIDELLKILDKYKHRELHVHHTWKPNHSYFNGNNHIELQQNMRSYHLSKGWSDIGQHATLMPDGTFVTGRDFGRNPASIRGHNDGLPFCVEMLGNFDKGYDKLEGKQKDSMLQLAKYFDDKGKYIRFHRENANKTCPGTSIDKREFMKEVCNMSDLNQEFDAKVEYEGKNVKGFILDGRTYLQVRDLAEMLGLNITWDQESRIVKLSK